MSDPVIRLNVALEGCYAIERELGEGEMAIIGRIAHPTSPFGFWSDTARQVVV